MKSIRIRIEEKICYLGLNRPEKSNSLNKEMIVDLITFLTTTSNDNNFKLLVLYGEGGGFCSGGCLEWMKQGAMQANDENMVQTITQWLVGLLIQTFCFFGLRHPSP